MADAGAVRLGQGTPPAWGGAGEGSIYFDQADGQLYFRDAATGAVVGPLGGGGGVPNPLNLKQLGVVGPAAPGDTNLYASTADKKLYSIDALGIVSGPLGAALGWGAGSVGPGVNYVDPIAGNDATAQFYNLRAPYKTVQAAINDAVDGDYIFLGPGTHFCPAVLNLSALVDITIVGCGVGVTVLDTAAVGNFIAPPVPFGKLRLLNMSIHSKNGSCVVLNGTGGGGAYMTQVVLHDLEITSDAASALYMQYVGGLDIANVVAVGPGGVIAFDTVTFLEPCRDFICVGSAFRLGWDEASADKPSSGRSQMVFQNTTIASGMQVNGQPDALFTQGCSAVSMTTAAGLTAIGGAAPRMKFYGSLDGYVSFPAGAGGIPDTATVQTWDFTGAVIRGDDGFGNALRFGLQGAAANAQTVFAQNARVGAGRFVFAEPNITILAGGVNEDAQFGGLGVIRPSVLAVSLLPLANGVGPQTLAFGINTGQPPRVILAVVNRFGGAPNISNLQIANKTSTGFDLYYTGVAVFGTDYIDIVAYW